MPSTSAPTVPATSAVATPTSSGSDVETPNPTPESPAVRPPADVVGADLLDIASSLPDEERARLSELREFLQERIRPTSIDPWTREELPQDLVRELGELGLGGLQLEDTSELFKGLVHAEIARADVSLSALLGIHNELIVGMIDALGSQEQKERWLPSLTRLDTLGAFALTEPDHGSDIAGGLATTATRDGDGWVLNGSKRWIGNGTVADVTLVWARDTDDGAVKAFVVDTTTPGYEASKITGKVGLRMMQNADITLTDVRLSDADRMPGASSFTDANRLLCASRAWVGWQATGLQMGAFDVASDYARSRTQFGQPIGSFQLIQLGLTEMLANVNLSLSLMAQVTRTVEAGALTMPQAALAKSTTTRLARETVSRGRGLLGGNGMLFDHEMAKLFADAEALYTYEGTYEINSLIVGRAITGKSAFV